MKKNALWLGIGLLCSTLATYAQNRPLKLWYQQPAGKVWEAALPLGNGRLAAMVYGNPSKEIIKLNEHTVWSGSPSRNDLPEVKDSLQKIQSLLLSGNNKAADKLTTDIFYKQTNNGMKFLPAGDLELQFGFVDSLVSNYYRELNLENAVTTTTFQYKGIVYTRKTFTSFADQVIVVQLTASKPNAVSFEAELLCKLKNVAIKTQSNGHDLSAEGLDHEGVPGKIKLNIRTHILNEGGTCIAKDKKMVVTNANSATIVISLATNYKNYADISVDEHAKAAAFLDAAIKKSYNALLTAHSQRYAQQFGRVQFALAATADSSHLPTDVRLKAFSRNNDQALAALFFQYGRYLLMSSSQPNGQPGNLQGIWNDKISPAWDSKYTININTQMNYWPAEVCNLSETHEPLVQMIRELAVTGKATAKTMYGARGWVSHHNTDLWRITGPVDKCRCAIWPMSGAWFCQHLWEKFLYNGDVKYLQSVYPIMKDAAVFFQDFLIEEPTHKWMVTAPTISPEQGGISAGVTMDNQILFDLFSNIARAAAILKTDAAFAKNITALKARLPLPQIGKYSQLQEWMQDIDDPKNKHRHVSHLFGLYPGRQISPYATPEVFEAAKNSLLYRGDAATGWSMGWKINFWARFLDGNHALEMIKMLMVPLDDKGTMGGGGLYPNMFDAHPPFQIDGNFGATSGIAEMLMQSHDGAVFVLPALPDAWKEGHIKGLKARGGFVIEDLAWKNGNITKLVVQSTLGGNLRLRSPQILTAATPFAITKAKGSNSNPFFVQDVAPKPLISPEAKLQTPAIKNTYLYDIATEKGKVYRLKG